MSRLRWCAAVLATTAAALAQGPKGAPQRAPGAKTETPQFKAIWEPVNYPEDVELDDVFFVSPDVGWVAGLKRTEAGEGGFIMHTVDGGVHWNIQAGDPHSGARGVTNLFFLDPSHGWAADWSGALLRTTDGETWQTAGSFSTLHPYAFVSPAVGYSFDGGRLQRTGDAGKSWKIVFNCRTSVEVDGLKRDVDCSFASLRFATPQVGYITSGELPDHTSAVFKTANGGATWALVSYLPHAHERTIGFADSETGFIKTDSGLMGTFDGGRTWKGIPVNIPGGSDNPIRFAGRVGWYAENNVFAYTGNGGKRWLSADLRLPAGVIAFSLPAPDRGYVVGQHGMIYRYRVVPVAYTSKGMLPAPGMPAAQ